MIKSISIKGFKGFRDVSLELGPLNLFIGANASGKSNFFDALRVLQGIGLGLSVGEIFDGKPRSSTSEGWEGIRGGRLNACFAPRRGKKHSNAQITVGLAIGKSRTATYSLTMDPMHGWVAQESLHVSGLPVFDSEPANNSGTSPSFWVRYQKGGRGKAPNLEFERTRPVLQQLVAERGVSEDHQTFAASCLKALGDLQCLDPSPAILRLYSPAISARRMGERGENFAAVVKSILENKEAAAAYKSWLERLTPAELDRVAVLPGAVGDSMFGLQLGSRKFAAPRAVRWHFTICGLICRILPAKQAESDSH